MPCIKNEITNNFTCRPPLCLWARRGLSAAQCVRARMKRSRIICAEEAPLTRTFFDKFTRAAKCSPCWNAFVAYFFTSTNVRGKNLSGRVHLSCCWLLFWYAPKFVARNPLHALPLKKTTVCQVKCAALVNREILCHRFIYTHLVAATTSETLSALVNLINQKSAYSRYQPRERAAGVGILLWIFLV